jgi:hypothetical protein
MSSVRDAWTDERLDDLNHRVDLGFAEVREEIRELRGEIRELRGEMTVLRIETNDRLDGIQRSMVQLTVAMTVAILSGFGGMAALLATQA